MLKSLLKQRAALLSSARTPLVLLRQLDRRLVLWCEHHPQALAVDTWREAQGDTSAFWADALRLELNIRLTPGAPGEGLELSPGDALDDAVVKARWQMVACYSKVSLPEVWPEAPEQQLWAAMAAARRGQEAKVDPSWQTCVGMQTGVVPMTELAVRDVLPALWAVGQPFWREWFFPLLLAAPEPLHPVMINWLAGQVDDALVIEAMGVSGCDRFLPWFAEMVANGGEHGDAANEALQRRKASNQDLGQRYRQWWAHWLQVQGAPWSLFGGRW